jgi:putative glycosyltransferase (TIGR04372 family)
MTLVRYRTKLLTQWLRRYPKVFHIYRGISWTFSRSPLVPAVKRLLARPRVSLAKAANAICPTWIRPRCWLALHYAVHGEFQKATAIADDVLARSPDLNERDRSTNYLSAVYALQGNHDKAGRVIEMIEKRNCELTQALQYDRLGLRFFHSYEFFPIGHLGRLDHHVKGELLGMVERRTNVILGAPEEFSNPAYVRYWEKYFSLLTERRTISLLGPISYRLQQPQAPWRSTDGRKRQHPAFARDVQLRWEAEDREPLLELSAEHRERGYQLLRELGVPEGAWFVGLHVRDDRDPHSLRNSDITTYGLAIEAIAKRGGWVLRMGNPGMPQIPPFPNAVDYAHSPKRVDWMDVFLWAEGRFFIGTLSGPQMIPPTFGKPVAITNCGPIPAITGTKDDILMPKQYRLDKETRYLSVAERLFKCEHQQSLADLQRMDIRVIDNSPEELRDVAVEMMDRGEGRHKTTEDESAMQAQFAKLAAAREMYPIKLARGFLSRYPDLL